MIAAPCRHQLPAWQLRLRQRRAWRGLRIYAAIILGSWLGFLAVIWAAVAVLAAKGDGASLHESTSCSDCHNGSTLAPLVTLRDGTVMQTRPITAADIYHHMVPDRPDTSRLGGGTGIGDHSGFE